VSSKTEFHRSGWTGPSERAAAGEYPPSSGDIGLFETSSPTIPLRQDKIQYRFRTCTMGMIVKETVQTLSRKGIWVAAATSWRAVAATVVYSRILSVALKDLGPCIAEWNGALRECQGPGIYPMSEFIQMPTIIVIVGRHSPEGPMVCHRRHIRSPGCYFRNPDDIGVGVQHY
jgi:hypothetical protein